jgi:hypothetical protein
MKNEKIYLCTVILHPEEGPGGEKDLRNDDLYRYQGFGRDLRNVDLFQ